MRKAPIFVLKIGLEPNENPRAVPASRYGAWVQSVKEVSQICELFGIIGEKENRRGKKNGTVAAG